MRCRSPNLNQDRYINQRGINESLRVLCNQNDIGNEYQYLLKCDYFNDERKLHIRWGGLFLYKYIGIVQIVQYSWVAQGVYLKVEYIRNVLVCLVL